MKPGRYGLFGRRVEKSRIFFGKPLDFSGGGRVEPFVAESKGGYRGNACLPDGGPLQRNPHSAKGVGETQTMEGE